MTIFKKFSYQELNQNKPIEFESYEIECIKASQVEIKNQPWLWPGVIPLHTTTLIAGYGGIGKSLLLINLAATISNGKQFSAGGLTHHLPHGNVLLLSAEDDNEYQIVPKLLAAQANLDNVYITKSIIGKLSNKKKFLSLDNELDLIKSKLKEIGNIKLIIIDPITYFLGNVKDYINTEVANFLVSLNDLAKEFDCAIILNKHLRKKASGSSFSNAVDEVGGSAAWVNSPRQSWIVSRHHENQKIILFTNLKVNIKNQEEKSMGFEIEECFVEDRNKLKVKTTRLKWHSDLFSINADQALNKETYEKSKKEIAIEFILNYLKEFGQSRQKAIEEESLKNNIKYQTFRDACDYLEKNKLVEFTRGIKNAKIYTIAG